MKTKRVLLAAVLGAACVPGIYAQEKANAKTGKAIKAVRVGKLWDGKGKLWTNAIVIVEADRIRVVTTDASAIPPGAETIDLSKFTGLPGLIDVHTHMTIYTDETPGEPMLKQLTSNPPAVEVFLARKGAMRTLEAGVDAAHKFGKKIAIHSYGPDGARDAVRAGTDSLEHATDMDDATIQEMAKRGTFYVPTIDHNRYYLDNWQKVGYANGFQEKTKAFIERNLETARKAHKAGVKFAMGSDAIYTMFGQNTRELGWFVKAGMSPEQALRTATTNAAELLEKEKELGAVAPGYFGDLVAVEGDPLADIDVAIYKVKWVMKGGGVVVDKT